MCQDETHSESLCFDANSKYFLLKWHFWGKTMVRIELKFCYHILNMVLITKLGMSESRFETYLRLQNLNLVLNLVFQFRD